MSIGAIQRMIAGVTAWALANPTHAYHVGRTLAEASAAALEAHERNALANGSHSLSLSSDPLNGTAPLSHDEQMDLINRALREGLARREGLGTTDKPSSDAKWSPTQY